MNDDIHSRECIVCLSWLDRKWMQGIKEYIYKSDGVYDLGPLVFGSRSDQVGTILSQICMQSGASHRGCTPLIDQSKPAVWLATSG